MSFEKDYFRDATSHLNSTDVKLAPQKLAPNLLVFIVCHQADLYGRGIPAHIYYSFHRVSRPFLLTPLKRILSVNKKHYKRDMFCNIKMSKYFVTFINNSSITMIFNIC